MDDVDPETRMKAFNWCKDYLGGAWSKIKLVDFQIVNLQYTSFSNRYFICSLPPVVSTIDDQPRDVLLRLFRRPPPMIKKKPTANEPKEVLLRVYGEIFYEGDAPLLDTVVFSLLSERRHAPKLYGVFREGRLEQYIPSRCLRTKELSDPSISTEIAQKLAEFHKLDLPLCKVPKWIDDLMGRWTNFALRVEFENPDYQKVVDKLKSRNLEAEVLFIRRLVSETSSPVVFCHNDAQEGNVLLTKDSAGKADRGLVLIDYEYAGYNYRDFDLANHFVEWTMDYTVSEAPYFSLKPEDFPTREQQLHFIRAYLSKFPTSTENGDGDSCSREKQEEIILREVQRFALVSHFIFSMWSVVQMKVSQTKWGYVEYAIARLDEYFRLKSLLPDDLRPSASVNEENTPLYNG